jgi:2-amino-4-hydroxy-6-hydroxymethyldihydropteridine diphosphokinase
MTERRFVLQPLRDIAPDVVHPLTGHTIEELFDACPDPSPVLPYKPSRQ